MSQKPMRPPDSDDRLQARLDDAFAEYLSRTDAGESVDLDELFERYADCADRLKACIEADGCLQIAAELAKSIAPPVRSASQAILDHGVTSTVHSNVESPNVPAIDTATKSTASAARQPLGDYELLEEIARGGMGIIYKARQRSLDRIVAVKVIADGQLATPVALKRFRSEARIAAKLNHPNIVSIHEIGEEEGLSYFSMDYVPGQSLATVLQDGPLPPREAAELLSIIARAVEYAHEQGLLHRDLKPSNVLLDEHRQPLVADFGLSRSLNGESDLTSTGEIVGTVSYMSPEQSVSSRELGPATDVYSLGSLLYALLVGRPPFQSDGPVDTLLQLREKEPVPPRRLNPKIPRDLETICLTCLEKSPGKRYSSARSLAEDVERFLAGEPIVAKPATLIGRSWRWCARNRAAGAALAIGLLSVMAIVLGLVVYSVHVNQFNTKLSEANNDLHQTRFQLLESQDGLTAALGAARQARDQAVAGQRRMEQLLYAADMRNGSRALNEGDYREVVSLLEKYRPGPGENDLRGIEWHLLKHLTTSPHIV
jgi:eukaryotic-like serine/threonine-protein kinase